MKRLIFKIAVLAFTLAFTHTNPASAQPAAANGNSSDALYNAIRGNDLAKLKALVAAGKDAVNLKDTRGETPLMYAAATGSFEAMQYLIDNGADVNVQNEFGSTALIWSATDLAKVRLLTKHGANVNLASKRRRTALLVAAMSDHSAAIVRLLIEKGADVKAMDMFKNTTLRAAALGNDLETMRSLIDAGVDVNAADMAGITPLMIAAGWHGNVAATKLLLARGAKVNATSAPVMGLPSKNGPSKFGLLTPLLMAAGFGPPELIGTLLDAGANVNAKDVRGITSLMLSVATDHQDPALIRMLLAHGATVDVKSDSGATAADMARKMGLKPGLQLLKSQPGAAPAPPATASPATARIDLAQLRPSVEKTLGLIEKSSWQFFAASGCVSCHAQSMTDLATGVARAKGLTVDMKAAAERLNMVKTVYPPEPFYERFDAPGAMEQVAYPLVGFAEWNYQPDRTTDGMVANIAASQYESGAWHVGASARPPGEEGDIFRTAVCLRALKVYGTPGRGAEMKARVEKARHWLETAVATTAEDRNMQLLGLHWAGADAALLGKLAKAILARQQPDGGWRPNDGLASDAYATGETLYALASAGGIRTATPAYQRGVQYLLRTQHPDGSWFVASRSPEIQAYFEGGFPFGHDQWISNWGTSWAALALLETIDTPAKTASR